MEDDRFASMKRSGNTEGPAKSQTFVDWMSWRRRPLFTYDKRRLVVISEAGKRMEIESDPNQRLGTLPKCDKLFCWKHSLQRHYSRNLYR